MSFKEVAQKFLRNSCKKSPVTFAEHEGIDWRDTNIGSNRSLTAKKRTKLLQTIKSSFPNHLRSKLQK